MSQRWFRRWCFFIIDLILFSLMGWTLNQISSSARLLYFIERWNGPLVLRLGGLRLMYWISKASRHFSPPSGTFWAETVLALCWNLQVWSSLARQRTPQNSRPSSPFMVLNSSSLIPRCSCLPRGPNCWVSGQHIVWIKDSGFVPPSVSLFQRISPSSTDTCRALFRRLPWPSKWNSVAFLSNTCLDELNSLSRIKAIAFVRTLAMAIQVKLCRFPLQHLFGRTRFSVTYKGYSLC